MLYKTVSLKWILLFISSMLFLSCSSALKIREDMEFNKRSLAYLYDSKKINSNNKTTVLLKQVTITKNCLNDSIQISRKMFFFLPLLFLNIWYDSYKCELGKSIIKEHNIHLFYKNAFAKESKRSGIFELKQKTEQTDYNLEINIDEIESRGPYQVNGIFFFAVYVYGYFATENAGPAVTKIRVSYRLKKDDKVILTKTFEQSAVTQIIQGARNDKSTLVEDYATNMVESLSTVIKRSVEKIITDVNKYVGINNEQKKAIISASPKHYNIESKELNRQYYEDLLKRAVCINYNTYDTVLYYDSTKQKITHEIYYKDGEIIKDITYFNNDIKKVLFYKNFKIDTSYFIGDTLVLQDTIKKQNGSLSGRDPQKIYAKVMENVPLMRKVYNEFLRTNPDLRGKLVTKFSVNPDGTIFQAFLYKSTTNCKTFDNEILNIIRNMKFEQKKGVGIATITYPFAFSQ